MQAVEGCSRSYVEENAWIPPEAWRRGDQWIVAYLKEICRVPANEVANTLSVAFGAAVVEHGGGVAYEPTKNDLEHYFGPLARAKDKKGWLAGVPYGLQANERPLRLTYLAPRVVALLRTSRGALEPLVLEAYDLAIGADNKAHGSAQKSVLKVQYASLVDRIAAVEMDADDARDAADTNLAAANETAALLAAERRSRAAEVNARVSARSDSRANLSKTLSLRIGTPTSRVHGGWHGNMHGKGRKKNKGPKTLCPRRYTGRAAQPRSCRGVGAR